MIFYRKILRNLIKNLNTIQKKITQVNKLAPLASIHTSSNKFVKKEEKTDDDEFDIAQKEKSKIRNLERLGVINNNISWPKYNRIIYPPTEDGKLIRNPVSLNSYFEKKKFNILIIIFFFSLFIT